MSYAIDDRAFDRGAEPLFKLLTPEQLRRLVALAPDRDLELRVAELADRAQEGELRKGERAEYEGYIRANNLLAVLQGVARRRLNPNQSQPNP